MLKMEKQETKRQHYVPETYLNKFGTERKENEFQVFALNKQKLKKPFPVNTSKICVETNLYTLDGRSLKERQLIEDFYSNEIEHKYNEIYEILTNDNIREVTLAQKELIIATAITLLFRVTKWLTSHNNFIERVFEKGMQIAEQFDKLYELATKMEDIEISGEAPDSVSLKVMTDSIHILKSRFDSLTQTELQTMERYSFPEAHREIYKTLGGAAHLDQNYTVFGEVVKGMDIVDSIAGVETDMQDKPLNDVRIISAKMIDRKSYE